MTENYEQWKVKWEKKHFYIQKSAKIGSMVSGKLKVYKCTLKGLSTYMVDPELHIPYYNEEFMKRWIYDMDKLYYYDTGSYPPPSICPINIFNTWMEGKKD